MTEYTFNCADCANMKKMTRDPAGRCLACQVIETGLPAYLKSREGRLHVHALVMQAEIAAGCEQSRKTMEMIGASAAPV